MIDSVSEYADSEADLKKSRRRKRAAQRSEATIDRLPPHDIEMEMGVLGCQLLDPNERVRDVIDTLGGECHLIHYDLRHQTIQKMLVEMYEARKPIDLITVQQSLKERQLLEQVGGVVYLSQLQDAVPSAANLAYYLQKIKEKSMLRSLIQTCTGIVGKVHEFDGSADDLVSESERDILAIRQRHETGRGETDISRVIVQMTENFDMAAHGEKPEGLHTGFKDIDHIAGLMKRQEMITVAGSPSAGKTSYLYNVFLNLAKGGIVTGLINMDTSAYSAIFRYSCCAGEVDGWRLERGIADEEEQWKMQQGSSLINSLRRNLRIRDDINSESKLIAACRRMVQQGCQIIGIDFLQQLQCTGKSKYDKVSRAAEVVKELAKDLNIPVIAISALNRDSSKDGKRPSMSALNGSGDIEYHSNKIILLHCEDREESIRQVHIDIAKNKDGRTGKTTLTMFAPQFRFTNYSPDENNP